MRSIPVPVHDVCLTVTVEVCQSNASAMLHGVLHTYKYMVKPCVLFLHLDMLTDLQGYDLLSCSSHQPAAPRQ